jgi:hypothetical protein
MSKKINPDLSVGDRIMCIEMYQERSVVYGDLGTVKRIDDNGLFTQIYVDWDNGSKLPLLDENDPKNQKDYWIFSNKKINENRNINDIVEYTDILRNFKMSELSKFLKLLQRSNITNMFGASPYLYLGEDILRKEHYNEDSDEFEELASMADDVKNIMIQGAINVLNEQNKEVNTESVGRIIKRYAPKILNFWMVHH